MAQIAQQLEAFGTRASTSRLRARKWPMIASTRYATPRSPDVRLARALGYFGVGLGLTQIIAPRGVSKLIGVGKKMPVSWMRALGARELTSGIGILSQSIPTNWVRFRIVGDVVDLALLYGAFKTKRTNKTKLAAATTAVATVTALDVIGANLLARREGVGFGEARVTKSIAINRPVEELYRFWRDLENLPRVMHNLRSVRSMDDRRSHWVAEAPAGMAVEWDAELAEDRPNQRVAWRSIGGDISNEGAVEFEPMPGGRGTLVRVDMRYKPPAGQLGVGLARLFTQEPSQQIAADLRRFKQLMETGEVTTSESPHGRRSIISRALP